MNSKFLPIIAGLAAFWLTACSAMAQTAPAATEGPAGVNKWTTLGTRSGPIPAVGRAQTSNLLTIGKSLYVVDAGPGVMRRLVRAGVRIQDIGTIFLSHGHNDHTAGLGELLTVIYTLSRTAPVNIYGPPGTAAFVAAQVRALKFDSDIRISDGTKTLPISDLFFGHDAAPGVVFEDANLKVTAAENTHFHFPLGTPGFGLYKSYSYRFDTRARSIVFTGDTGYSEAVVDLAKGADLYVSEVNSLEDYKQNQIRSGRWEKMSDSERENSLRHLRDEHLTPDDVGKMAARAGVKAVVLTHLPGTGDPKDDYARYVDDVKKLYSGPVSVAKDLMEF